MLSLDCNSELDCQVIRVSEIILNWEHDLAILFLENRCGSNCYYVNFLVINKREGIWQIKHEEVLEVA